MTPDEALRGSFRRSAMVHDWLTIPGGSEKVLMELLELFPGRAVHVGLRPRRWPALSDRAVHTSFLDRVPGRRRHYPKLLPFMNSAFESFDLSGFDLVVPSSHSCAKNVLTGADTLHVCYCHTDAPRLGAAPPGRRAGR